MKKLTPEQAWDMYWGDSVKLFISFFYAEGITDIKEMCWLHAQDIPSITGGLYTINRLDYIAKKLEDYIKNIGYDENSFFTERELQEICDDEINKLFSLISGDILKKS
ncbi:MAG: hypothetical protein ACOX6Z_03730 [Dethiobacteria bacterium]|jgi:hypothetical protein